MKNRKKNNVVLIYILLVFVLVISVFPILYTVFSSLRLDSELFANMAPFSWKSVVPIKWTLENYLKIITEYDFLRYLGNTLIVIALVVPGTIAICSLAAFAFAFYDFKFKKLLFSLFLLAFMVPGEAIALPLYSLCNKLGLVNTFAGIVLPSMADGLVLFLFVQFFSDIPRSLLEAVRIDGGGWWTEFTRIVIPLSVPVVITASLMIFVNQWNDYLWPLMVARSKEVKVITVAVANFKEQGIVHWGYIYAAASISALIPIFIFLPFQKYFVEGITSCAIKE